MSACEDNDFTETFSGEAQYSKHMWLATWKACRLNAVASAAH